ncbi:FecR family protein [Steroidobacter sp.]|uniref:FecR family protein n=1 Tax=Steroidobacter sp. TaxID=1978227 RepID=UPI001A419D7A|nr:FecR domain-containing protein [Steroidobacter sp.]MBL8266574.1 FecR domain-containing protein [Steroidobacter sp.]
MSDTSDVQLDAVTVQATEWFARMRESELSAEQRAEFDQWIAESPVHVREYLAAAQLWGTLHASDDWTTQSTDELVAQARASANIVSFPTKMTATEREPAQRRSRRRAQLAIAASVLVVLGAVFTGWMTGFRFGAQVLATERGEQRSTVLSDGSLVQLNTMTRIEVSFDAHARRIHMSQGEAFFRVAHDTSRPFEVITPFGVVRAVGTEFNVYSRARDMRVAVVEGKVQVSSNEASAGTAVPTLVGARQSVEVAAGAVETKALPPSQTELATAWRQRRLAFENERLDAVVAEFNRYNRVSMRIDDAQLAALQINGVFDADDPQALLGYLQRVQRVVVAADSAQQLTLKREINR